MNSLNQRMTGQTSGHPQEKTMREEPAIAHRIIRLFTALAIAACGWSIASAANITWSTTDFNVDNLDLSGNVIQAINFSATPQTVTIGGNTVTFASSSTIANGGFTNGPNETAAGVPTYANVVGNAPLGAVLA